MTTTSTPFSYRTRILLSQTDAAGVVYFTRPLEIFHEAFEAFLDGAGCSVRGILDAGQIALPIVEAGETLKAPLFAGDVVDVGLFAEKVSGSSFILRAELRRGDDVAVSTRTVHVCIDRQTRAKAALPESLVQALRALPATPPSAPTAPSS